MKLFAKKRNKIILLLVFALILIVYFVYATVISFKLNDIIKNADNQVPFSKKYINKKANPDSDSYLILIGINIIAAPDTWPLKKPFGRN